MGLWQRLARWFAGARGSADTQARPDNQAREADLAQAAPRVSAEEAFALLYITRALEHPRVERVERVEGKPLDLRVYLGGTESPSRVYLGNKFRETRDCSPEEKISAVEGLLSILDVIDEDVSWADAEDSLVPLVRVVGYGAGDSGAPRLLGRPFVPFLRLYVGLDRGQTFSYVTRSEVDDWGQTEASVFDAAFGVLLAHVERDPDGEVAPYDPDASYGIWHVVRDDSYESSRLALPGYLASFRGKVSGNPIAIVPQRSLLVISGDAEVAAIARLARLAETEFNASPRSISPALYTIDAQERVVPLHLPPDHPQYIAVERGHRLLAASCYGDQKAELEKTFDASGRDIFVASYFLVADKQTEQVRSWASWKEGVETLLPEVDQVALGPDDGEPVFIAWDKLVELAGQLLELEPGLDPPRHRTLGFPSRAVLEQGT